MTAVGKTLSSSIMEVASQGVLNNLLFRFSGTAGPNFTFQSANGTLSTPTALLSNNILGRINFSGYNGSSYINTAMIRALTEADAIGFTPPRSRMDFLVSQGAYMVEGISITGDLRVGIMENDPQTTLHVDGHRCRAHRSAERLFDAGR
ncbi:MAG: hypothetical protein IPN22_13670 [Bacteroidetes bacterium]|nr:hypothetical protein [Bacteroidota bacterium]